MPTWEIRCREKTVSLDKGGRDIGARPGTKALDGGPHAGARVLGSERRGYVGFRVEGDHADVVLVF